MVIMGRNVKVRYKSSWAWGWGIFLLLIAALILANQFGGFLELGFWSIAVAALAVAFLVQCIVDRSFGSLPIPLAALYFIFQAPLSEMLQIELPAISFWPLVLVTLLVTAGLYILLPHKRFRMKKKYVHDYDRQKDKYRRKYGRGGAEVIVDIEDAVEEIGEGIGEITGDYKSVGDNEEDARVEESGGDNNPRISVQFTGVSKYLHADSLETADLDCSFGSLEVYFDHVKLSPNGADIYANCKFGALELYVPGHWRIIDNVNASLAGFDISGQHKPTAEDAPQLRVNGNVSFGALEIHRV